MALTHQQLCDEIADQCRQLSDVEALELHTRRRVWEESGETSAAAREQVVRYTVTDLACEVLKIKGEIRALEYELRAVEWAGNHAV